MRRIILASNSPRRREILRKLVPVFDVESSDFDESSVDIKSPKELVEHLSRCKAEAVLRRHSDSLVISGDSVVVVDSRILGKPKDALDAASMLRTLSGKMSKVITAFTIMDSSRSVTRSLEVNVFMRDISDDEIDWYVRSGEPMDKAGAYGIQGLGGAFIERIEGDYYSAVGLPLCELSIELKKFGITF